jgi:PIN domain nuclease of toxin-antitoxin system
MIVLDTHVWLWLLHDYGRLSPQAQTLIAQEKHRDGLRVSAISMWEIAVKVEQRKLVLPLEINEWYEQARVYTGLSIEPVTPADFIASTQLPGNFHKDPADRIIVAFARRLDVSLISCDAKILNYPYVETAW